MPKVTCINPVFVRLLEEWKEEVIEKNPDDSRQYSLAKAISGIRASKEVFRTPDKCRSVKGVGPKILAGLNERYAVYLSGGDASESNPSPPKRGRKATGDTGKGKRTESAVPKKRGHPSKTGTALVAADGGDNDAEGEGFVSLPHGSVVPIPRAVPGAGLSQYSQMG